MKLPAKRTASESTRDVLRQNLKALMGAHPILRSRKALEDRTDVSARSVGYLLQEDGADAPSPTLETLEAIATAYKLEVWELLFPGLDVSKIAMHVPPKEAIIHRRIEADLRTLGATEARITKGRVLVK